MSERAETAHGFAVTAFDVAPTAIDAARRRFPDSSVDYRVADGPPWPLTRAELDRFERTLRPVDVGVVQIGPERRWRGEYAR